MAMLRTSTARVRNPNIGGRGWLNRVASDSKASAVNKDVIAKYSPDEWLLSHVSIVASVDTELADPTDPKSNYLIKPEHSDFVNNNDDCWERELLKKCYHTFLGANNYVEHVQIPELSKGKIVDVALREVDLGKDVAGNPNTTLYVDLLVATNKKHEQLCQQIESGEFNAMSMGCLIQYSICSRCGNKAHDETEACEHIKYYKGNEFYDSNGKKRVIAELCGHKDDPESVKFIEASWVKNPAFPGAVLRSILNPPTEGIKKTKDEILETLSKNKDIPQDEHHEIIKNASIIDKKADEPPVDDTAFPETPADTTPVDTSPEEGASDLGSFGADQPPAEGQEGEEGQGEDPQVEPEEAAKTPVEQIQQEYADALLTQVKQQLMVDSMKYTGVGTGEGPGRGDNDPYKLENDTNSSLIKEAASAATSKYLWDRYSIDINALPNKRLAGALLLSTKVASPVELKRFGFSRKDIIGLMGYMDRRASSNPLCEESLKFLAKKGSDVSSKKTFFEDYIIATGLKPSSENSKKIWKWANILKDI
jgi:hypothetical protein